MNHNPVRRILKTLLFVLLGIGFLALFGWVVMSLWNWLTPALFGWKTIGYWQAFGLIILCRLLFGGVGGPKGSGRSWRRNRERWEQMTPEEREKFRQGMRGCRRDAPPAEANPSA
jgi:H+/Cl- antiporter ClcA